MPALTPNTSDHHQSPVHPAEGVLARLHDTQTPGLEASLRARAFVSNTLGARQENPSEEERHGANSRTLVNVGGASSQAAAGREHGRSRMAAESSPPRSAANLSPAYGLPRVFGALKRQRPPREPKGNCE